MFVQRVKQAMNEQGISQSELVKITGISRSGISQYLSGKNIPRKKALTAIANALNVSPEWLVESDNKKITVQFIADLMNTTPQTVRIGLQQGEFPFGVALKVGSERYTYLFYPEKVKEYFGIKL